MKEDDVRAIAREEAQQLLFDTDTTNQFGVAQTSFHTHNGIDSQRSSFTNLSDVPNSYYRKAGYVTVVNSTETGLTFQSISSILSDNHISTGGGSSGGSGTPGGSDTDVQFNDAGSFGGSNNFTWDNSLNELVVIPGDAASPGFFNISNSVSVLTSENAEASYTADYNSIVFELGSTSIANQDAGAFALNLGSTDDSAYAGYLIFSGGGVVTTTDDTPSTAFLQTTYLSNANGFMIEAYVKAFGTVNSAGYIRRAMYTTTLGGTSPTLVGSIQDVFTQETDASWDCTFDVVSTTPAGGSPTDVVSVTVTGGVAETVGWNVTIKIYT